MNKNSVSKKFNSLVYRAFAVISEKLNAVKKDRRKYILVIVFITGVIILVIQTVLAFWRLKNNF